MTYINTKDKENGFPPLQKRIILYLAQSKPQTINEIKTGIKGHYKSTHTSFKALEKKGLVKKITSKHYRGRQYPCFWLTTLGIHFALVKGAKTEVLLKTTSQIYPENKNLQFIIETAPILGKNVFKMLQLTVSNNEITEQKYLISIFDISEELTPEQKTQFTKVLKKYPEAYQQCANLIKRIQNNLKELSDLF